MTEEQWDKKLKIHTTGRLDGHADQYHYPYEPTPYVVLERLAESGYLKKENILVDYGCGKGRVGFFLHYAVGCTSLGLEYDAEIFQQAKIWDCRNTLCISKSQIARMQEKIRCGCGDPFQEYAHNKKGAGRI